MEVVVQVGVVLRAGFNSFTEELNGGIRFVDSIINGKEREIVLPLDLLGGKHNIAKDFKEGLDDDYLLNLYSITNTETEVKSD